MSKCIFHKVKKIDIIDGKKYVNILLYSVYFPGHSESISQGYFIETWTMK